MGPRGETAQKSTKLKATQCHFDYTSFAIILAVSPSKFPYFKGLNIKKWQLISRDDLMLAAVRENEMWLAIRMKERRNFLLH